MTGTRAAGFTTSRTNWASPPRHQQAGGPDEASGYCRRLPNPDDRRSSLLELTEEGRRMLAEAGTAFDELQHRLGAALPERTLRQFASTLTRLRNASRRAGIQESA